MAEHGIKTKITPSWHYYKLLERDQCGGIMRKNDIREKGRGLKREPNTK